MSDLPSSDPRIGELLDATDRIRTGTLPVAPPVAGDDDVARLGRALADLSDTLARRFREQRILGTITQRINHGFLLEEILDDVYGSFREILPYDRIGFALLNEDGDELRAHWARSEASDVLLPVGFSAPMAGSSLEEILRTGQPRIINDLHDYLKSKPDSEATQRIVGEGIRSSLTCPLVAMGKSVGFLFFSSRHVDTYRNAHIDVFLQISGQLAVVVEKSRLYEDLLEEQKRSEHLLLNILPRAVADRLRAGERRIADHHPAVTVLFADLVGFATWSEHMLPEALVEVLDELFTRFDELAAQHGVEKIKTLGDAYMAAAGVPVARPDHADAAAALAVDMLRAAHAVQRPGLPTLELRIGLHSGPVVAGVVGRRKFVYDLWGDTVNTASRMESHGVPGCVQISDATRLALGPTWSMTPRGVVDIKGKGPMQTWLLRCPSAAAGPASGGDEPAP